MSNLNQFLLGRDENKPKHTAKIRGNKPAGTTDEDEGRRGLLRHQDDVEDDDRERYNEEGLRDAV